MQYIKNIFSVPDPHLAFSFLYPAFSWKINKKIFH